VACAALADDTRFSMDSVQGALRRAHDERRVVQIFLHDPGKTVSPGRLEAILSTATELGLRFVTYRELAAGVPKGPGIALSFDDWYTHDWAQERPLFDSYGAQVTFFVSDYDGFGDKDRKELRSLADDGHDIEYHSTRHQDAPKYVREHGMAEYLAKDIDPALAVMRADGYDPIVFAYPLGFRTRELDVALLARFALLRATTDECPH
jgi:peptidoglycan/xylan/chitin deacetylase (PgdA/CDA1 family)